MSTTRITRNRCILSTGVWVNDYVQNSHRDAYDKDFYETFLQDCRTMLDVVHGQRRLAAQQVQSAGYGSYKKDISPWVIGYILGVEWDDITVAYTDDTYAGRRAIPPIPENT